MIKVSVEEFLLERLERVIAPLEARRELVLEFAVVAVALLEQAVNDHRDLELGVRLFQRLSR